MALGMTQLEEIRQHKDRIVELCGKSGQSGLFDQCNTFNYVVKHLDDWASEVPRIEAIKEQVSTVAAGVTELTKNTVILTNYIDELVNNLQNINNPDGPITKIVPDVGANL